MFKLKLKVKVFVACLVLAPSLAKCVVLTTYSLFFMRAIPKGLTFGY